MRHTGCKSCASLATKLRLTKKGSNEMSNVVSLRPSDLEITVREVVEYKPEIFVVVAMRGNEVSIWGPKAGFDMIQMYGMLEYAKTKLEPETNVTPKQVG